MVNLDIPQQNGIVLVMKRLKSTLVAATRLCECVDFQMVQNNVGITETMYMCVTTHCYREGLGSLTQRAHRQHFAVCMDTMT